MLSTDTLAGSDLFARVCQALGSDSDTMESVVTRAEQLLPGRRFIVWEGDALTFHFSYVSDSAEEILGYPVSRWTTEPTFWADTVVHTDDRNDAIAFCALATGRCRDHDFVYRAIAADGQTVWLHDVVKVFVGSRDVARTLRGLMLVVNPDTAPTK